MATLSRAWLALGKLVGRATTPVAMAVLFAAVFTPMAVVLRWLGHDPLRLARTPGADNSYWIPRPPAHDDSSRMSRQF
jgi:hypothetical protein